MKRSKGFSFIELLIVLTILGIIAAIVTHEYQKVKKERAGRSTPATQPTTQPATQPSYVLPSKQQPWP